MNYKHYLTKEVQTGFDAMKLHIEMRFKKE
jgi:hypothetical protein